MKFCIFLFCVMLLHTILSAQITTFANSQTNFVIGTCTGCSVENAENAADTITSSYATMNTEFGTTGVVRLNMIFPAAGTSTDIIAIGLRNPDGIIDLSSLESVTFIVKNASSIVGTFAAANLLAINLIAGTTYAAYVLPSVAFDEVDVKIDYVTGALTHLDVFYATYSTNILGISLNSFTAEPSGNQVHVAWQSAGEHGLNYFTLERSTDAISFSPLAEMNGNGNSNSAQNYFFDDLQPATGNNYYRLKQTDFDGTTTYSSAINVEYARETPGIIYASFQSGQLRINGDIETGDYDVLVCDINGEILFNANAPAHDSEIRVPASMHSGIFLIKITKGNTIRNCKASVMG